MTNARVGVGGGEQQSVYANPEATRPGRYPPVEEKADVREIRHDQSNPIATCLLQDQGSSIETHPVPGRTIAFGTVAGESHTNRWRDVHSTESRLEGARTRSGHR
jgi:hypothetical protein